MHSLRRRVPCPRLHGHALQPCPCGHRHGSGCHAHVFMGMLINHAHADMGMTHPQTTVLKNCHRLLFRTRPWRSEVAGTEVRPSATGTDAFQRTTLLPAAIAGYYFPEGKDVRLTPFLFHTNKSSARKSSKADYRDLAGPRQAGNLEFLPSFPNSVWERTPQNSVSRFQRPNRVWRQPVPKQSLGTRESDIPLELERCLRYDSRWFHSAVQSVALNHKASP